jgi:glycosyltransferase involved in cell wall biosynthesis
VRVSGLAVLQSRNSGAAPARPEPGSLKRILALSNCYPFPPTNGIALRVCAILQGLAAGGHEIELLCFGDPAAAGQDQGKALEICKAVQIIPNPLAGSSKPAALLSRVAAVPFIRPYGVARSRSKRMANEILDRLRRHACDVVLCEETDLLVNVPDRLPVPLIVDHHNAEHVLLERYLAQETNPFRRAYARVEARKVRNWERRATLRAGVAMVCSDVDRATYRALCPSAAVIVAPNVIDVVAYTPATGEEPETILYAGGMDWYPNRDAVEFFAFSILPRILRRLPGARFIVAGRNPTPEFRRRFAGIPSIEFTGAVPDMRPLIARAAVCVVPLRIGSGTRLKILEAAATAKPVVSTTIGVEGLDFARGSEILLADDPDSFASAVVDLLNDAQRRRLLGAAARRRVEQSYSIATLHAALREALGALDPRF